MGFDVQRIKENFHEHGNRSRSVSKIFNSILRESSRRNTSPTFSEFNVEVIDIENCSERFEAGNQENVDLAVLTISTHEMVDRLRCSKREIPNYEALGPSSGILFLYKYLVSPEMANKDTPRIMRNVIKNVLFIKSFYEVIPGILTYKNFPVRSLRGTRREFKSTLFKIKFSLNKDMRFLSSSKA